MAGGEVGAGGVPSQAGILEGSNPSKYNPADPIVLFIIQVGDVLSAMSLLGFMVAYAIGADHGVLTTVCYHHHCMSSATLASFEVSTAEGYCGGYWRNCTWYAQLPSAASVSFAALQSPVLILFCDRSYCSRQHSRLYGRNFPEGIDAQPYTCGKPGTSSLPIPCRT
jgi:hypothetical protein